MSALARVARLPAARRRLLLRALPLVALVRLALTLLPYRAARRGLLRLQRTRVEDGVEVNELAWAVAAAARAVPAASCLTQALALETLLARRGLPAQVRVGVARGGERIRAHAWVESEGRVVLGGPVSTEFAVLR